MAAMTNEKFTAWVWSIPRRRKVGFAADLFKRTPKTIRLWMNGTSTIPEFVVGVIQEYDERMAMTERMADEKKEAKTQ